MPLLSPFFRLQVADIHVLQIPRGLRTGVQRFPSECGLQKPFLQDLLFLSNVKLEFAPDKPLAKKFLERNGERADVFRDFHRVVVADIDVDDRFVSENASENDGFFEMPHRKKGIVDDLGLDQLEFPQFDAHEWVGFANDVRVFEILPANDGDLEDSRNRIELEILNVERLDALWCSDHFLVLHVDRDGTEIARSMSVGLVLFMARVRHKRKGSVHESSCYDVLYHDVGLAIENRHDHFGVPDGESEGLGGQDLAFEEDLDRVFPNGVLGVANGGRAVELLAAVSDGDIWVRLGGASADKLAASVDLEGEKTADNDRGIRSHDEYFSQDRKGRRHDV
mmetsp:Transcript_3411/g.8838  ORF Transcript_3411/g.8838 Transcript_3411/m.8838 type:complete len:337 (+) Transcript_3411:114-1124(+)